MAEQLSKSVQPLVPERLVVLGGNQAPANGAPAGGAGAGSASVLTQLLTLLLAQQASSDGGGVNLPGTAGSLKAKADPVGRS